MSLKKKINDIKKNYSLGIIGGGQLALMLTEAAQKRDLDKLKLDPDFSKLRYELSDFLRGLQKN